MLSMVTPRDWSGLVILTLAVACSGRDGSGDRAAEQVGQLADPLTAGGSVLGFEEPNGWEGPGASSLSPLHTEGTHSLAVRPVHYSVYTSDPFEATGQLRSIALGYPAAGEAAQSVLVRRGPGVPDLR